MTELHTSRVFEIKIGMVFALEELAVDSDIQDLLASNNVGALWPGSSGERKSPTLLILF